MEIQFATDIDAQVGHTSPNMSMCRLFFRQWPRVLSRARHHGTAGPQYGPHQSFPTATLQQRSYASISAAELKFGQPLHETHPHILSPSERVLPILTGLNEPSTDCCESHARDHCARVRPASFEVGQQAAEERNCRPGSIGGEIPSAGDLLRISTGFKLLLPYGYANLMA